MILNKRLDESELTDALKQLYARMKEGYKSAGLDWNIPDEDKTLRAVAKNILTVRPDITASDLKDLKFKKTLCTAIMSDFINKQMSEGEKEFNYALLFKKGVTTGEVHQIEKNELKLICAFTLKKMNDLKKPGDLVLTDEQIEALSEKFAASLSENILSHDKEDSISENEFTVDSTNKQLSDLITAIYGTDTTQSGKITFPVKMVVGNLYGFTLKHGEGESSRAFIDEVHDLTGPDYVGNKNINYHDALLEGFDVVLAPTNKQM